MKKLFCIIMAAALLLPLAACAGKGTEDANNSPGGTAAPGITEAPESTGKPVSAHTGPDYDNRFGMNLDNLIETEDAYYFRSFGSCWLYYYYYDKASGERGVLCAKPECMHDEGKGDSSCNGLVAVTGTTVNYWDGRIHYRSNSGPKMALFSVALDGSDKQVDLTIDDSVTMSGITPQRLDYHRGMLYGYDINSVVRDGEPYKQMIIFSIDPETGEFREIYSALNNDGGITAPYLVYKQNFVYISYDDYSVDEDYKLVDLTWHLLRWNIDTEEMEEVAAANSEELNDTSLEHRIFVGDDGRVWFVPRSNMAAPLKVYLLEDGSISEAFSFDTTGACFMIQGAAVTIFMFEERWEVRRLDGSLIWEGELDTSWLDGLDEERSYTLDGISSLMGTPEEIFISFGLEGSDGAERYCLVRYDMTGEKPVPTVIANARCTASSK